MIAVVIFHFNHNLSVLLASHTVVRRVSTVDSHQTGFVPRDVGLC